MQHKATFWQNLLLQHKSKLQHKPIVQHKYREKNLAITYKSVSSTLRREGGFCSVDGHPGHLLFAPPKDLGERGTGMALSLRIMGGLVLLTVLAIVAHLSVLNAEFLTTWGDSQYLLQNEDVQDLPSSLPSLLTSTHVDGYSPVGMISLGIDHMLWGDDPMPYHTINLLLHLLNTGLVMWLGLRLFNNLWVALLTAGLFAVHPVQVESVMWISQRGLLLSALFFLLALHSHIESRQQGDAVGWRVVTWLFFALAVFSKPLVVFGILVFMVYDMAWHGAGWLRSVRQNAPGAVLSVVSSLLAILAQAGEDGLSNWLGDRFGESIFDAIIIIPWTLGDYVLSLLVPLGPLAPNNLYEYTASDIGAFDYLAILVGLLAVISLAAIALWQPLGRGVSWVGVVWVIAFMLPVLNLLPQEFERADRYMYLPSIMLFGMVSFAAIQVVNQLRNPTIEYGLLALAGFLLVVGTGLSFLYSDAWQDDDSLWEMHLDRNPDSPVGLEYRGIAQFDNQEMEQAGATFRRLLEVDPDNVTANQYLGVMAFRANDYLTALDFYSAANENAPQNTQIRQDLGATYFQLGLIAFEQEQYEVALSYYARALRFIPEEPVLHNNIGYTYFTIGDYENAVIAFTSALQLNPSYGRAWANLGNSTLAMEDYILTRDAYERSIELGIELDARGYSNYCLALAEIGENPQLAADMCTEAINREPGNGLFLGRTAHMLLIFNQNEQALGFAQRAVAADPTLSLNYRTLGDALLRLNNFEAAQTAYQTALQIDPRNQAAQDGLESITGDE
jgi:tetratricopeptide (TPR) repeat protein